MVNEILQVADKNFRNLISVICKKIYVCDFYGIK